MAKWLSNVVPLICSTSAPGGSEAPNCLNRTEKLYHFANFKRSVKAEIDTADKSARTVNLKTQ